MKNRNPLFVAGFPYIGFFIGYIGLNFLSVGTEEGESLSASTVIGLVAAFALLLIGGIYVIYWLVDTAKVLRKETDEKIPNSFLIIVPLVSYWWMWRYSQAVEKYTKGKITGVVSFILLFLVGSIGMGILQDTYNKLKKA